MVVEEKGNNTDGPNVGSIEWADQVGWPTGNSDIHRFEQVFFSRKTKVSRYAARLRLDARQQRCRCSTAQRSTFCARRKQYRVGSWDGQGSMRYPLRIEVIPPFEVIGVVLSVSLYQTSKPIFLKNK